MIVFLVPVVLSFVVAVALSRWFPSPAPFWQRVVRWLSIAVVATLAMIAAQRLLRRLLPLAALFSLTLVFPDETPSRFGLALRGMSARSVGTTPRPAFEGAFDPPTAYGAFVEN